MNSKQNAVAGVVFIFLSTVAWSLTGYFTRLLALDTITIIGWRGLFGSFCLVGLAMVLKGKDWRREFRNYGKQELIYIASTMAGAAMLFAAFAYTSVAHVAVIYSAIPFIAAILGWLLLHEIPTRQALVVSSIALAGVWLMVAAGSDGGLFGDLLALGMTFTSAYAIILIRRNPKLPAIGCSATAMFVTSLLCLPFADPQALAPAQLGILAVFGLVNSTIGVAFFAFGSRRLPAVQVGVVSAVDMPLAAYWVWLAFDERPEWNTLIGGVVVMATVLYHILTEAGRRRPVAIG